MAKFRRSIMWGALVLITLLILFSIYGAFIGADRAQLFFNTLPLTAYWITFILLLGVGIGLFRRLLRFPGLLLIHLGCIFILIGAMWGSEGGHQLQKKLLGTDKIQTGNLVIYEGMSEERVLRKGVNVNFGKKDGTVVLYEGDGPPYSFLKDGDERIFLLPFKIKLKDFRMDYYSSPRLLVKTMDGRELVLKSINVGEKHDLGNHTWIKILKVYKNFKVREIDGKYEAYDQDEFGSNPAVRILIRHADGTEEEQFAFANFSGHMEKTSSLFVQYRDGGMVRDYFSDVQVIDDGKVVLKKTIQVNDPLYYGGYHFYQSSYDTQRGYYTVLSMTSDSGLYLVYSGYLLLLSGIVWQMWLTSLFRRRNMEITKEGGRLGA